MQITLNNSELARTLYKECGTDPKENYLMPMFYQYSANQKFFSSYSIICGHLINYYATENFDGDWIPFNKKSMFTNSDNWKQYKSDAYRLKKRGIVEMKEEGNQKYIRLIKEDIYNKEHYRRREYE